MSERTESLRIQIGNWSDVVGEIDKIMTAIKVNTEDVSYLGELEEEWRFDSWRDAFKADWRDHEMDKSRPGILKWWRKNKSVVKKHIKELEKRVKKLDKEKPIDYDRLSNLSRLYRLFRNKELIERTIKEFPAALVRKAKSDFKKALKSNSVDLGRFNGSGRRRRRKYSSCSESSDSE